MKLATLATAALLALGALAFVPDADAVGTCTYLTNAVSSPDCPHLFCYGTSWSYGDAYYTCHRWIDPPCSYCVIMGLP